MKRVFIICGMTIVLLAVVIVAVLVKERAVSKLSGETARSWYLLSTNHNIDENSLNERHLQPVWFGPPRLNIPETSEEIAIQLQRAPRDKNIVARAAVIASQQGKWEEALAFYRKWSELDPKEINAYLGVVYALVNLRRASEALDVLKLAKRRSSTGEQQMHYYYTVEGDVYLFLALDAKRMEQEAYKTLLNKAEACYSKAQELGNFSARAPIGLLRIALERGQLATAQEILDSLYKAGVTSQREQALIAYYQGVVLERRGDLNKAREYYRAAVRTDPASFAVLR